MDEPKLQCPSRHRRVARLGLWFAVALALASCQPNATSATSTTQVPCAGCHTPDWQTTVLPNHQTKGFGTDCAQCHQTKAWRPAKGFDHALAFPLLGKHATVVCQACHTGAQLPAKTCAACHEPDYLATQAPNHVAIGISTDCGKCHTNDSWKPTAGFDHATVFPLLGKHTTAACAGCHVSDQPPPKSCAACHAAAYAATTKPNHAAVGLPTTCETCHSPVGWKPATGLNHDLVFPLLGKHATAACTGCHVSDAPPPKTCAACHAPAYAATTKPNHAAIGLSTTCEVCHTADAWLPASGFDHAKVFPLLGKHVPVACAQCHTSNRPPPKTCVGCHMTTFLATTQPNHQTTGLPTTCDACHTPSGWKPAALVDHALLFPLLGKHATAACGGCHVTEAPPPKTCLGCHATEYLATTQPNHKATGLPTTCDACHTPAAWVPASGFDHAKVFPLLDKHATVACAGCHTSAEPPASTCFACHSPAYWTAAQPNHANTGMPTTCESCHTAAGWHPAQAFDHAAVYPLVDKHQNVACSKCHTTDPPPPKTCVGCHMPAYLATTAPNHGAIGIATACETCHTTADWKPAPGFDHAKVFALLGKHVPVACTKCHTTNQPPPKTCVGCHLPAYLATTAPNHQALGIATACETCHTTADWKPAPGFDHAKVFALLGKHTVTPCTACHTTPSPPPKLCFACHQANFLAAKNPDHVLLGFPTSCESCHSATAWQPATMVNHTPFFPISSGKHANLACTKCHDKPASFKAYTCLSSGCHAQSATNGHHTEVLNYVYASVNCYQCHPKGVSD